MYRISPAAAVATLGLLAACAAPAPAPEPIRPEPVFNKFGTSTPGDTCTPGYIYVPGTVPELALCVPEDDCDEVTLADGSVALECPPPRRTPNRDPRDPDDSSVPPRQPEPQRDPTGAPIRQ